MNNSDSEIIQVSEIFYNIIRKSDQEEALDPQDLPTFKKNHVKLLYPHKEDPSGIRKYFCCQACCESPGYFCCCTSSNHTGDFNKFGLSICLYFKFLKHSLLFYLFLSLLLILSCVVCYKVAEQNSINPLQGYSNFLFSTTYGAFSSEHNKCQYSLLKQSGLIYQANFEIKCPVGTVNILSAVLSKESLNSLYNCRNEKKKVQQKDSSSDITKYRLSTVKKCNSDSSKCTINQTYNALVGSTLYTTVSYNFQCLDNHYKIGSIDQKSRYYLYFVVAIDVFFCLCFMMFIRSQIGAQKDEIEYFKGTQASLDDFSLKLKGFTTNTADKQFQALVNTLQLQYPAQNIKNSIVSYSFQENQSILTYYKEKVIIFTQIRELMKQYFFEQDNQKLSFRQCCQRVFQKEGGRQKMEQYIFKMQQLIKTVFQLESKRFQIQETSQEKIPLVIVFDSVNKKKMIKKLILDRRCCSKNQIGVGNNTYQYQKAPVPDMVLWQNQYSWTKLRVFISWIFTLAICVGSYLLFGYIQYQQNQLFTDYNYGIDCSILYTSAQLTTVDTSLLSQPNYVTCICKDQSLISSSSSNSAYCSTWKTKYRLYLIVPLLISLGLVVYNVVVSQIFRWMSHFEKHKFVIDQDLSYTLKRAFLLIMNMGLIMILLNYNYNNITSLSEVSFIFLGKFNDFTADWYQNIGSIIALTLIFNIVTPIAEFFLSFVTKCLRKCWDTRCYKVSTSSLTKTEYLELFIDDIFPIGEKYAYLIATFFVTFSFCGVMPILIPISAISFFLLYFSDKLLLFKFYQTPKNYTTTLHKFFIKVLIFSFVSHFALTTYFLTEPTLIAANSNITSYNIASNSRINAILKTVYVYPYLGLLALFIIYFVFTIFCGSFLTFIKNCICAAKDNLIGSTSSALKKEINLWKTLSKLQIETLLKITQYNLDRYRLKQQGDIVSRMNQHYLDQTQHRATMAAQILENAVEKLSIRQRQQQDKNLLFDLRTVLIGLPSYDFLIKKDKISQNNLIMVKIETELKHYYKQKIRMNEQKSQMSPPQYYAMKKDNSACQLYTDII